MAAQSPKPRRKPAKTPGRTAEKAPARHRTRVRQFTKSMRGARHWQDDRQQGPVLTIVACLGLMAMIALASRQPSEAQLTSIGPVAARPVQAAVLSGGRKQQVCITNKTSQRVDYSLYWGGTAGRQYALEPGYYMIHSSPYSAAPLVEYFGNDEGEPARQVVKALVTKGNTQNCQPNYSFEYKALDSTRWSGEDRYGLYGDERAEATPGEPPFVKREWET